MAISIKHILTAAVLAAAAVGSAQARVGVGIGVNIGYPGYYGGGYGHGYYGGPYYRSGYYGPWRGGYGWGGYYGGGVIVAAPPVVYAEQPVIVAQQPALSVPPSRPDPVIYPRNGQGPEQTEYDRQECNRWATTQRAAVADASVFQRAVEACMDGRGYSIK